MPPARLLRFVASNEPLVPPWPRLIISIGRRSVPIALALKDVAKAYALHIQNPKVPKHRFDLIAAPIHDGYTGDNVVITFGAVHSVTAEPPRRGGAKFRPANDRAPPPAHRRPARWREPSLQLSARCCCSLRRRTRRRSRDSGGSLLVTPSRRTPPEALARACRRPSQDVPHFVWDGTGENPYFALLASADAIVVTEDPVNMVTEAAGTGKPVYVQRLKGKSAAARPVPRADAGARRNPALRGARSRSWSYAPINDTEMVASVHPPRALALKPQGNRRKQGPGLRNAAS